MVFLVVADATDQSRLNRICQAGAAIGLLLHGIQRLLMTDPINFKTSTLIVMFAVMLAFVHRLPQEPRRIDTMRAVAASGLILLLYLAQVDP